MDAIRVSKVEQVTCNKSGRITSGTLHLTAHHLIFRHDDSSEEEMWVPYPLISLVTRLPQTIQGLCPITFHLRTFESFQMTYLRDSDATDVFESVKELTVATSVNQLYAFFYRPNPSSASNDGWNIYSPREEFGRMGIGSRTKAWRFTDINKDYSFCSTYPARLVVPTKISDTTLQYASKYRSKARIPALTYLHWGNYGSITRSSQPMVGLTQSRSIQDEKLIEAVFQSHISPESRVYAGPVYGSTATNLIIDARPTTNAVANTAKGAGTENMDHYKDCKKAYLGIDNIHVMRESLNKVVEALREADNLSGTMNYDIYGEPALPVLDRQALRRSGWLRHISAILEGTVIIARNVHINSSHVLIHCSDGWDRTSQLSSLSQLCLDPFYRTMRGFEVLIEKDWVSFGHKFLDRCGHLSSDKFFLAPVETTNGPGGVDAAQAFFQSVQNRFASQHHVKETSPVFHQFLEAVRQVQRQFPDRFEFSQRFLQQIHLHLYSCQFGTFLFNSERERRVGEGGRSPYEHTLSVWDFLNSPEEVEKNRNPSYDKSLDDPMSRVPNADMGVLLPNTKDVRFWHELYGRTDEEMNGRVVAAPQVPGIEFVGPVETAEDDPVLSNSDSPFAIPLPPSPAVSPPVSPARPGATGLSGLSLADASRELSSSMPEFSSQALEPSGYPYNPSSSTVSLRPPGSPSRSSSPGSHNTPARARSTKPGEYSGLNSGLKSMWGKLSTNASAAFSVVQDAYGDVAKEFKGLSLANDGTSSERSAELRSRDHLSTWGEDPSGQRFVPANPTYTVHTNPWSTANAPTSALSETHQNPWSSVRAPSPQRTSTMPDMFDTSTSLPSDPTVAHPSVNFYPTTTRNPVISTPARDVELAAGRPHNATGEKHGTQDPSTSQKQTDPLGVGLLS